MALFFLQLLLNTFKNMNLTQHEPSRMTHLQYMVLFLTDAAPVVGVSDVGGPHVSIPTTRVYHREAVIRLHETHM